jgi:F0F1-type ATP synthase assembly protein I
MAGADLRGVSVTQTPQRPRDDHDSATPDRNLGWTALSYLISGMAVWGFLGWLADRWVHTGGILTAIGIVIGAAGGVYLVVRHMGSDGKE